MTKEPISKATRTEFRELLMGLVLRDIDTIFEAGGFSPKLDFAPNVSGQRRSLVEQYYANIDFRSPDAVRGLLITYAEAIDRYKRAHKTAMSADEIADRIDPSLRRMARDGFSYENGNFRSQGPGVLTSRLSDISAVLISEQIDKARAKVDAGDSAGAITNAYTLVEGLLKEILRRHAVPFNDKEGDIRALYQLAADPLNLNPKGENLESYLKTILQGLKSQVAGLYELANKASDRHARRYHPAPHHAKLAVNATFSLCEFLLDSIDYQQKRARRTELSVRG
jgi:hypothetical protein